MPIVTVVINNKKQCIDFDAVMGRGLFGRAGTAYSELVHFVAS
jgi:hypothetical protein